MNALVENRLEAVASLTRELAARAGGDIDIFNRTVEAVAYHGQLSVRVEAFRIAWPGVKSSKKIVPWGVSGFMNRAVDYEIFDYLPSHAHMAAFSGVAAIDQRRRAPESGKRAASAASDAF